MSGNHRQQALKLCFGPMSARCLPDAVVLEHPLVLCGLIAKHTPGETIKITVERGGKLVTVEIILVKV